MNHEVQDYNKLHPKFEELIDALMKYIRFKTNINTKIAQAVRTIAEQDALYAKGRTKPGPKVTNAKGGQSMHNFCIAVDLCLDEPGKPAFPENHPIWEAIGKACEKFGLEWGGSWKTIKDRPHVQLPVELKTVQERYKSGGMSGVFDLADEIIEKLPKN